MTKVSGIGNRVYYHGTDISGDVASFNASSPVNLLPLTNLTSTTEERMQGLASGQFDAVVYFNDALSQPILDSLPTTDVVVMGAMSSTRGDSAYCLTGKRTSFDPTRNQDGSLTFATSVMSNAVTGEWAQLLTAGQVTVADENATAPTGLVTAQSTYGGVGFLQFESRDSGTPTFLIEDSDDTTDGDDGTWATLLTFANTGGASAFGERKTVTGTVEKGIRAGTPTGTYANAKFVIAFRRGELGDRENLA